MWMLTHHDLESAGDEFTLAAGGVAGLLTPRWESALLKICCAPASLALQSPSETVSCWGELNRDRPPFLFGCSQTKRPHSNPMLDPPDVPFGNDSLRPTQGPGTFPTFESRVGKQNFRDPPEGRERSRPSRGSRKCWLQDLTEVPIRDPSVERPSRGTNEITGASRRSGTFPTFESPPGFQNERARPPVERDQ